MQQCGDKSLSVGENSFVQLDYITASDTKIGIASKDSSLTLLNEASFKNLETCLTAYNKKQEFDGSIIKVNKFICNNFEKKVSSDKRSLIFENNNSQKLMSFRIENKLFIRPENLFQFYSFLNKNLVKKLHEPRVIKSLYLDNLKLEMYKDPIEGSVPRKKLEYESIQIRR